MSAEDYAPRSPEAPSDLPARLSWRAVSLFTSDDGSKGMLVFWGELLIAVFGRVDLDRLGRTYLWHLEVGFGDCVAPPSGLLFQSLAQALRWVVQRMEAEAPPAAS